MPRQMCHVMQAMCYVKLNVIGMQCSNLIREQDHFLGPFPDRIEFTVKPLVGGGGVPQSSDWPNLNCIKVVYDNSGEMKGGVDQVSFSIPTGVVSAKGLFSWRRTRGFRAERSREFFSYGPDSDAVRGVYRASDMVTVCSNEACYCCHRPTGISMRLARW